MSSLTYCVICKALSKEVGLNEYLSLFIAQELPELAFLVCCIVKGSCGPSYPKFQTEEITILHILDIDG